MAIPQGEETYILCRTAGRKEGEGHPKTIFHQHGRRLETLAEDHRDGTGRRTATRWNGGWGTQERHPSVNDLYEVSLHDTAEGVRLSWLMKEDRKSWRESREGAYLLRTNIQAETAEGLWAKYMQLTEAEASFRALKSELSIRPLFHQLEQRVKAHVMVAFLAMPYG